MIMHMVERVLKLRFFFVFVQPLVAIGSFFVGGHWLWSGAFISIILDSLIRHEYFETNDAYMKLPIFTVLFFLPLAIFMVLLLIYFSAAAPDLPIDHLFHQFLNIDLQEQRDNSNLFDLLGGVVSTGVFLSFNGGVIGHELMHDTKSRLSIFISRVLLSFCFHSQAVIDHVYFHHRNVGFLGDTSTCPRGMNVWIFIVRAFYLGNRNSHAFERKRLKDKNTFVRLIANRTFHGYALSGILVLSVFSLAGSGGVLAFIASSAVAIVAIEAVNYVTHYGLVRIEGTPVSPHHSWNSMTTVTTSVLLNLPRHSHHHFSASVPYWKLEPPKPGTAPTLPLGSIICATLALFPPLFYRLIAESLEDWDQHFATDQERDFARNNVYKFHLFGG